MPKPIAVCSESTLNFSSNSAKEHALSSRTCELISRFESEITDFFGRMFLSYLASDLPN